MNFKLRPTNNSDCELLWIWRNEINDKQHSFNSNPISYENHIIWFNTNINNPNKVFYIMELEQLPVGQIRIDINEFCEGEVHITVDNQYRNMGLASKALFMLEESIKKLGVNFLIAHIKPTNINSVILFIKSGFIFSQLIYFKGFMCYELKKEIV